MKYRYRESHEMKDSGVEWLGMIPKEWEVSKIGKYFQVRSEKVSDTEYPALSVSKNGIVPQMESVAKTDNNDNRKKVCINDFVINSRADRKGSCGVSKLNGSVSLIAHVLKISEELEPNYIHYLFRNYYFSEEFYRWGTGIVDDLWSTNIERMKKINIPFFFKENQQKIADFLDKKCEEFDSVIAKKETLINKLEEAKKSLISEVVTGKVKVIEKENGEYGVIKREVHEMKDSGIEWLGMIAKEWEVSRVRHLVLESLMYGANESAELDDRNLPRYIRITDFGFDGKLKEDTFKSLEYEKAKNYLLKENDILFARSGGTVGKTFIFKGYNKEACFAGYLIKARFNSKKINPEFAYYFTQTNNYENWKNSIFSQATIQNIGADKYNELKMSYCELDKQNQMIDFLDKKYSQFDIAIEKQKESIEKLKSAKQSLISEAVTGKIEIL